MRKHFYLILFSCITLFLSGCTGLECGCGYTKDYSHPYYGRKDCGPKITFVCDRICDHCSAQGPICQQCWDCINKD